MTSIVKNKVQKNFNSSHCFPTYRVYCRNRTVIIMYAIKGCKNVFSENIHEVI